MNDLCPCGRFAYKCELYGHFPANLHHHDWVEQDSQITDPRRVEVRCRFCLVTGEKWVETGEVDYPCT